MRAVWFVMLLGSMHLAAESGETYQKCMEYAGGATQDVVACMMQENERLDQLIRAKSSQLEQCVPKKMRSDLRSTTYAFDSFKEGKCELYIHLSGGTGDVEDALECMVNESSRYADDLEKLLKEYCKSSKVVQKK